MADPLSIATGIGGLLTLADVVFGRLFKYVQAAKGASKEMTALSSEVGALYGILSNLHLVSRQMGDQALNSASRVRHIDSCAQTLEKLQKILDKDSMSSTRSQAVNIIKQLHWPFTSSEVKALLIEIERHKSTLGLALTADSLSGMLKSLSFQGAIRDSVDQIKAELRQRYEADTRIALNAKRQSVLMSFGKCDPAKDQKTNIKLRQPGTGIWLVESQEFVHWTNTENAKLWLQGIPGAGKTVLASVVIEEALRTSNSNHAVAFFYCDYKDSATQTPRFILGSLLQQIAKQDEESFKKLQNFCDIRNPECKNDFEYDPQHLRDLISDVTLGFDRTTIIVDGLDECGVHSVEVTELLASLNLGDRKTTIKTLFLSRDEFDIRECLQDYVELAIVAKR
ncbi:MAG: hypothetical protein Q9218_007047, partial [Villophora microphyllina]